MVLIIFLQQPLETIFLTWKKRGIYISSMFQEAEFQLQKLLSIIQSFPRFDQDFINNIKLVYLEKNKLMCIILTDLGVIKTDLLYSPKDLDESIVKQIEDFFLWRMNKKNKPNIEDTSILKISQQLYNEIMVRYIIGYSNEKDEIYKTGLSKLLQYPDFKDPVILAEALSIFENS